MDQVLVRYGFPRIVAGRLVLVKPILRRRAGPAAGPLMGLLLAPLVRDTHTKGSALAESTRPGSGFGVALGGFPIAA